MYGGVNGLSDTETENGQGERAKIVRMLRDDPAKVLLGSKAMREILKRFIIDPDGEVSLKEMRERRRVSERDLITAFKVLALIGILEKKKKGKMTYYLINRDSYFGKQYTNLLRIFAGIMVASTEMEEDLNLSDYIR